MHHMLMRFGIDSSSLYRKRLQKMIMMNFQANYSVEITPPELDYDETEVANRPP